MSLTPLCVLVNSCCYDDEVPVLNRSDVIARRFTFDNEHESVLCVGQRQEFKTVKAYMCVLCSQNANAKKISNKPGEKKTTLKRTKSEQ